MVKINVDKNIKIAETLSSDFYKSEELFDDLKHKGFYKSWQFIEHKSVLPVNSKNEQIVRIRQLLAAAWSEDLKD